MLSLGFTTIFHFPRTLLITLNFLRTLLITLILDERYMDCLKKFKILRKVIVSNWYQNLDYKLIRECDRFKIKISQILVVAKGLQNYLKSKFTNFGPPFPPCSSLFILYVLFLPTYIRFCEFRTPSQKKVQDAYEFLNEKLGI